MANERGHFAVECDGIMFAKEDVFRCFKRSGDFLVANEENGYLLIDGESAWGCYRVRADSLDGWEPASMGEIPMTLVLSDATQYPHGLPTIIQERK